MSVGKELEKTTGLKLFHNHMTIELVVPFFNFGTTPHNRLVGLFRREIFKEVANSDLKGIIFTFVWAHNLKSEKDYVDEIVKIFTDAKAQIYYIELEASLEERLRRNKTPQRLRHKPTKRDTKNSEKILLEHEQQYRFNTKDGEFQRENYLKIDNTNLSAKTVAKMIKRKLDL